MPAKTVRRNVALSSINASTLRAHESNVMRVKRAGFPATLDGLAEFFQVETPHPKLAASSCMAIVRSFRCLMRLNHIACPAEDYEYAVACAKGYGRERGSAGRKTPGAITWEQVQQVSAYVNAREQVTTPAYRMLLRQIEDVIKVMFVGGLRVTEAGTLARDQIRVGREGDRRMYIVFDVRPKDTTGKGGASLHRIPKKYEEEIRAIHARAPATGPMWPWYSYERVANVLNKTAMMYRWNPALRWSPHSLRYGAAAEAHAEGGDDEVFSRLDQDSASMRAYYASPAEVRLASKEKRTRKTTTGRLSCVRSVAARRAGKRAVGGLIR
jgi:integrase